MKTLIALVLVLAAAAPARAADTVVRTFDKTTLGSIDAYRDRVAWTESASDGADSGTLMTLEGGVATPVGVAPVRGVDLSPGPGGRPVAVYDRCRKSDCRFYLYDFAAKRERTLKGAPGGTIRNWSFWRDSFAIVRGGRLQVVPLGGKARDVGRAKSLAGKEIDFNGAGISYINDIQVDDDVEEFDLAYWPVSKPGRILMKVSHGASGDLSLVRPALSGTAAYATQRPGEFGGPWRLWRVDLRSGERSYAGLPADTSLGLPLGGEQAIAYVCAYDEKAGEPAPCTLVLHPLTYRD